MPGFHQLGDIPQERREALLRTMRALRADGDPDGPGSAGTVPATIIPGQVVPPEPARPRRVPRPRATARMRGGLALVAGVAALAAVGAVLLYGPGGHDARRVTTLRPPSAGVSPGQATSPASEPAPRPASSTAPPSAVPVATRAASPVAPATEVAGIGCPDGLGQDVTLDSAFTGPGWLLAGGGWTGDGCDGTSAWTGFASGLVAALPGLAADPPALTWSFHPQAGASRCTLAVYVPTRHALGEGQYAVFSSSGALGTVLVNQAATTGRWVTLGTYQVAGPVAIQFSPQGGTSSILIAAIGSPVAASAARAACS